MFSATLRSSLGLLDGGVRSFERFYRLFQACQLFNFQLSTSNLRPFDLFYCKRLFLGEGCLLG
jgi:hypothetical protein